ncbi:hypothetical protein BN871_CB_00060 [Paenibacillus sp. P22]|nr:hypothetical protein BN871_CB_00060 [Paenibacillus sp. P22]
MTSAKPARPRGEAGIRSGFRSRRLYTVSGPDFAPAVHIRSQGVRNPNAAVFPLMDLQQRNKNSRRSCRRIVEREAMPQHALVVPVADAGTPGLEIKQVRRRMRLPICVPARHPGFQVELLVRLLRHIPAADGHDAVRQLQQLQHLAGMTGNFPMEPFRLLPVGPADDDLLDLGELMHPVEAMRVAAGRAGFAAEAGRHRRQPQRLRDVDDLAAVVVHERHLRRAGQPLVPPFQAIGLILARREKSGARERFRTHHDRHFEQREALAQQDVQRQLLDRPVEQRAVSLQIIAAGAARLDAPGKIDHPVQLAELDMAQRREAEFRRLSPCIHLHVVKIRLARRSVIRYGIGHFQHQSAIFTLGIGEGRLDFKQPFIRLARLLLRLLGCRGQLRPHMGGDLRRCQVPRLPQLIGLPLQLPPQRIRSEQLLHIERRAFRRRRFLHFFRIFPDPSHFQHAAPLLCL